MHMLNVIIIYVMYVVFKRVIIRVFVLEELDVPF